MSETPKIIVGLGNPGKSYETTRHNAGFMILDRLAKHWGSEYKADKRWKAHLASGPGVLLVKPQTYMNESGMSVGPLAHFFKMPPERIFVVYDDVAFPLGTIKIRPGGSAGGHNGLKSLIAHLGTQDFPRLRFGIGAPQGKTEMTGHVLGNFRPDEQELLDVMLAKATDAVIYAVSNGIQNTANIFNVE